MVTVSQIAVNLSAQTADFERGMKKSTELTKRFALDFKSIGNVAAGVSIGSMLESAAGQLKSLVGSSFEFGVAQAALSENLGVSAAKLAGLQLAADYAEVSQEDLSSSLMRLSKNIGEATLDGGELVKTFEKLGLNPKQLAAMHLDQAFSVTADAIAKIENNYEQAALAAEVFGKGGIKLMNILRGGSEELERAQMDAQRFGTALSEIDIERFKALDDQMDKLAASVKGAGLAVASDLAPAIADATNWWLRYYEAAKGKTTTGFEGRTWESLAASIKKSTAAAAIGKGPVMLKSDLDLLTKTIDALVSPTQKLFDQIGQLEAAMARGAIPVAVFRERFKQLTDELDKPINDKIVELEKAVQNLGLTAKEIDLNEAFMQGADDDQMAIIAGLHEQLDAHKDLEKQLKANRDWQMKLGQDAKHVWQETLNPLEVFRNKVEEVQALFTEGFLDQETFERGLLEAKNALESQFPQAESGPSAKLAGSQAAFGAIDRYHRANDPGRSLQSLLQQAQRQTEIQGRLAKEMAAELAGVIGVQGI